jgi:glycerol-3-phosphate dehydrogenase (NAD(P)+)
MTEVIAEAAPDATPAILSGPGFAGDVARGLPTAVTLAAKDEKLAAVLVQALGSSTFRPYPHVGYPWRRDRRRREERAGDCRRHR